MNGIAEQGLCAVMRAGVQSVRGFTMVCEHARGTQSLQGMNGPYRERCQQEMQLLEQLAESNELGCSGLLAGKRVELIANSAGVALTR